jgi:hypothetical protein
MSSVAEGVFWIGSVIAILAGAYGLTRLWVKR